MILTSMRQLAIIHGQITSFINELVKVYELN
jgi:hypothetical protein